MSARDGGGHRGYVGMLLLMLRMVRHARLALVEKALVGQEVLLGIHHVIDVLSADESPEEPGVCWAWQTHPLISLHEGESECNFYLIDVLLINQIRSTTNSFIDTIYCIFHVCLFKTIRSQTSSVT